MEFKNNNNNVEDSIVSLGNVNSLKSNSNNKTIITNNFTHTTHPILTDDIKTSTKMKLHKFDLRPDLSVQLSIKIKHCFGGAFSQQVLLNLQNAICGDKVEDFVKKYINNSSTKVVIKQTHYSVSCLAEALMHQLHTPKDIYDKVSLNLKTHKIFNKNLCADITAALLSEDQFYQTIMRLETEQTFEIFDVFPKKSCAARIAYYNIMNGSDYEDLGECIRWCGRLYEKDTLTQPKRSTLAINLYDIIIIMRENSFHSYTLQLLEQHMDMYTRLYWFKLIREFKENLKCACQNLYCTGIDLMDALTELPDKNVSIFPGINGNFTHTLIGHTIYKESSRFFVDCENIFSKIHYYIDELDERELIKVLFSLPINYLFYIFRNCHTLHEQQEFLIVPKKHFEVYRNIDYQFIKDVETCFGQYSLYEIMQRIKYKQIDTLDQRGQQIADIITRKSKSGEEQFDLDGTHLRAMVSKPYKNEKEFNTHCKEYEKNCSWYTYDDYLGSSVKHKFKRVLKNQEIAEKLKMLEGKPFKDKIISSYVFVVSGTIDFIKTLINLIKDFGKLIWRGVKSVLFKFGTIIKEIFIKIKTKLSNVTSLVKHTIKKNLVKNKNVNDEKNNLIQQEMGAIKTKEIEIEDIELQAIPDSDTSDDDQNNNSIIKKKELLEGCHYTDYYEHFLLSQGYKIVYVSHLLDPCFESVSAKICLTSNPAQFISLMQKQGVHLDCILGQDDKNPTAQSANFFSRMLKTCKDFSVRAFTNIYKNMTSWWDTFKKLSMKEKFKKIFSQPLLIFFIIINILPNKDVVYFLTHIPKTGFIKYMVNEIVSDYVLRSVRTCVNLLTVLALIIKTLKAGEVLGADDSLPMLICKEIYNSVREKVNNLQYHKISYLPENSIQYIGIKTNKDIIETSISHDERDKLMIHNNQIYDESYEKFKTKYIRGVETKYNATIRALDGLDVSQLISIAPFIKLPKTLCFSSQHIIQKFIEDYQSQALDIKSLLMERALRNPKLIKKENGEPTLDMQYIFTEYLTEVWALTTEVSTETIKVYQSGVLLTSEVPENVKTDEDISLSSFKSFESSSYVSENHEEIKQYADMSPNDRQLLEEYFVNIDSYYNAAFTFKYKKQLLDCMNAWDEPDNFTPHTFLYSDMTQNEREKMQAYYTYYYIYYTILYARQPQDVDYSLVTKTETEPIGSCKHGDTAKYDVQPDILCKYCKKYSLGLICTKCGSTLNGVKVHKMTFTGPKTATFYCEDRDDGIYYRGCKIDPSHKLACIMAATRIGYSNEVTPNYVSTFCDGECVGISAGPTAWRYPTSLLRDGVKVEEWEVIDKFCDGNLNNKKKDKDVLGPIRIKPGHAARGCCTTGFLDSVEALGADPLLYEALIAEGNHVTRDFVSKLTGIYAKNIVCQFLVPTIPNIEYTIIENNELVDYYEGKPYPRTQKNMHIFTYMNKYPTTHILHNKQIQAIAKPSINDTRHVKMKWVNNIQKIFWTLDLPIIHMDYSTALAFYEDLSLQGDSRIPCDQGEGITGHLAWYSRGGHVDYCIVCEEIIARMQLITTSFRYDDLQVKYSNLKYITNLTDAQRLSLMNDTIKIAQFNNLISRLKNLPFINIENLTYIFDEEYLTGDSQTQKYQKDIDLRVKKRDHEKPSIKYTHYGKSPFMNISYDTHSPNNCASAIVERVNICHPMLIKPDLSKQLDNLVHIVGNVKLGTFSEKDVNEYLSTKNWNIGKKNAWKRKCQEIIKYVENNTLNDHMKGYEHTCFIKNESYPKYKPPRIIADADPIVKAYLAMKLRHLNDTFFTKSISVKHLNDEERYQKLKSMTNPLCLDHSAFESSINQYYTEWEIKFYQKIFNIQNDQMFDIMRRKTYRLKNRLVSAKLTKTRMSGDFNTSLGNTIVNWLVICWVLDYLHIPHADPICEGDDSITNIYRKLENKDIKEIINTFRDIGFTTTIQDDHSYCGLKWDEYGCYRDIEKNLRKMLSSSHKNLTREEHRKAQLLSLAFNTKVSTFKQWADNEGAKYAIFKNDFQEPTGIKYKQITNDTALYAVNVQVVPDYIAANRMGISVQTLHTATQLGPDKGITYLLDLMGSNIIQRSGTTIPYKEGIYKYRINENTQIKHKINIAAHCAQTHSVIYNTKGKKRNEQQKEKRFKSSKEVSKSSSKGNQDRSSRAKKSRYKKSNQRSYATKSQPQESKKEKQQKKIEPHKKNWRNHKVHKRQVFLQFQRKCRHVRWRKRQGRRMVESRSLDKYTYIPSSTHLHELQNNKTQDTIHQRFIYTPNRSTMGWGGTK